MPLSIVERRGVRNVGGNDPAVREGKNIFGSKADI